jgi:UDP-N-acetylmuramate dehydrogenase
VPGEAPEQNIGLAQFTTLGVGGPARWFAHILRVEDVNSLSRWQRQPVFVLGGGSNLVVADEGFHGLVLRMAIGGMTATPLGSDDVIVTAGAGEWWDGVVEFAVKEKLAGLECLSGIPGTVGGTPIQNVGAYGQEVATAIEWVAAFDRSSGAMVRLSGEDCRFSYRMSRFKREDAARFLITEVAFRLKRNGQATVAYPDLIDYFAQRNIACPGLQQVRDAVLQVRRRKGMVLDPGDIDTRSVGSFFMNPVVDRAMFERIAPAPHYVMDNDAVKIPAAWLIQQSGFAPGRVEGAVGLSTKHPLAIINRGGATAREVLRFAHSIKRAVGEQFGVNLRPEPVFVGFPANDDDVAFLTS